MGIKEISIGKMAPSFITLMALAIGMTAIRFALDAKWEMAVFFILIAAILDAMDGRLARLLGSSSRFGEELDSLADAGNFGIAPALIVYIYSLHHLGDLGWAIGLFYIICMVFRLARFNAIFAGDVIPSSFFVGVPAPVGGVLCLFPMMIHFQTGQTWIDPFPYAIYLFIVALALISRIPTFSLKKFSIHKRWASLSFIGLGLFGAFIVSAPWLTMILLIVAYIISIFFSIRLSKKQVSQ